MNSINSELEIIWSLNSHERISGLTHNFYRYPARFSPEFAREIISKFTHEDDYVLDAFMGSGTTIIEAIVNGRNAVGVDINPLFRLHTFDYPHDNFPVKNSDSLVSIGHLI